MRKRLSLRQIIYICTIFSILLSFCACAKAETENIFLTDDEVQWLKDHEDQIRIGYTTDYPPVEFIEDGDYVGFSADYFKLLEEKLSVDFEMVQFDHWNELIDQVRSNQITGITAATKTEERSEYLEFTVPYILNPNVIITRENFSEQLTFQKLEDSSMDVLVVAEYAIIEYIDQMYPDLEYQTVQSASDGMRKVSFGEADAMIIEIMSAAASIDRDNITNLVVNTETPYDSNLSIATRKDWPMLNQILNKGLAQITDAEKQAIRTKWLPMERKSITENKYFWWVILGVIGILSAVIIGVILWNRALQKAVDDKTEELKKSTIQLELQNKQLEHAERLLLEEIEVRKASEERIKYKSYHDELTGLYNRAYYNEQLIAFDKDDYLPLSIILADLNGLKITNDTLGHDEGDRLLINVASIISQNCRANDVVARIGGDEFVVVLPNASEEHAKEVCQMIKDACSNAAIDPIKPSVALGSATKNNTDQNLSSLFKIAEDNMYENKMYESEGTQSGILESMKAMLRETTAETSAHSHRMEFMALKMGEVLGLSTQELNALSSLADLHDLGKIAIPEHVLLKEGPLTEEEWEKIKRHPDIGFKIASSSPKLSKIAEGILAHHEHWDGSGYPHGLKGEEIPLLSRIITITDAFDVMTTGRPYKAGVDKKVAIEEIERCSGTQFDPMLVRFFVELFAEYDSATFSA